ncbi:MAG: bifunctional 5,10-methylenetetrahydrofolate dehydrogenase/5,10-methenyltetrahydrofolate cyclohydrolase [Bacilli bacterium]|nr:bifunctional 5,10-methylenetetrahydrofolate dehydrogenase/5,10-methenyltetrahydrofolate cyclohydrolase [Bacilli bacterium]
MNKIIDGKLVRDARANELMEKVKNIKDELTLVVISVGNDEASRVYVGQKEKMANKIGYSFLNLHYDEIEEEELIHKIEELNNDQKITGIIVQLPLPAYLNKEKIINAISPLKDVDGLTNYNLIKLIKKEECLIPCTPLGIMNLLDYYKINLETNIVIVGRSELVGLPLFHLLENRNATVTLCHSKTKNLGDITKNADILIVCVGKKELITKDMVKDGGIIIDVGINREDDKLYGDVSSLAMEKAQLMTPVPGGVGPMTVISLMENVYKAYCFQNKK